MDTSKALTFLSALILAVCLVLSITALTSLRHAVDESAELQEEVVRLRNELADCVDVWKESSPEEGSSLPTVGSATPKPIYSMLAVSDQIAIYAEDGTLIRMLDVNVEHLPVADREALQNGIQMHGWQAVQSRIADYTS